MKPIVICCTLWALSLFAQAPDTVWTKTFGGGSDDIGYALQQTSDGGYIIAGCTESFGAGGKDVLVIRTDADGGTIWTQCYGGPEEDGAYAIQEHWDGDYLVAGYTNSFGAGGSDIWILKIDAAGDTLWTETYGDTCDEIAYDMAPTADSGFVITGARLSGPAISDTGYALLMKFDLNCNACWLNFIETWPGEQEGFSVIQTMNGEYMVCGISWPEHPAAWVARADSSGSTLWSSANDPDSYGCIREVAPDTFAIVGPRIWGCCGWDITIRLMDGLGNIIWEKTDMGGGFARHVEETTCGDLVIAGETGTFIITSDLLMTKVNQNTTLWTTTFGGTDNNDGAYAMLQTLDDGYVVVGYTDSFGSGGSDVWLLRFEPDVGIDEQPIVEPADEQNAICATIFRGPLHLPEGKECTVFDITGRVVTPETMKPGIYFIGVDDHIIQKVIKVR